MNLEQLKKSAYSHHKATEAIVQKIINNDSYKPHFFPIIAGRGENAKIIIDASEDISPNLDCIEAYVTMGSFSLELKMKLLVFVEKGKWVRGHKLITLYDNLTHKSKEHLHQQLQDITQNSEFHTLGSAAIKEHCKVQFSWEPEKLISNSSEAFEKWRYHFEEKEPRPWFAGYSELQQAFDRRLNELTNIEGPIKNQ